MSGVRYEGRVTDAALVSGGVMIGNRANENEK